MTGNRDQSSRRASVSVTFDNLGEAAEIQLGIFGADQPRGEHFSVLEVLPRVLELLESLHLRGTFFVEGLNAQIYPEALRSIAAAGHEVAAHAWCHEPWAGLGAEREADLLARTTTAMNEIGIRPRGFRPPGGVVTEHTAPLLLEQGYSYHSPAGQREGVADGLAVLPFRWPLVDAYYYMPQFSELRQRHGDDAEPLTPQDMLRAMLSALDAHPQSGGHLALLFHPFLAGMSDECFIAMRDVLERVQKLAVEGCCQVTRMDETARELLSEPAPNAPELDASTWT